MDIFSLTIIAILIVFFLIIFFCISFFYLNRNYLSKENIYLLIPIICFIVWGLSSRYSYRLDFICFYRAGRQILTNPAALYKVYAYVYLPSFAIFFAFTFSLLPFQVSVLAFILFNYITGVFAILEFNKILILMDVKKKEHRFIFLILISNGFYIFYIFYTIQFKFLVLLILLLIIRMEIQYRRERKEKNRNYYILNLGLFIFLLGMCPYFVFLLFIYVFQEIQLKNLVKKENVEIYFIVVLWFVIQNFTFILYPSQIFEAFKGFYIPVTYIRKSTPFYLRYLIVLNAAQMRVLILIYAVILTIITMGLIHIRSLNIEEKFSFFLLAYRFFGISPNPQTIAYVCLSFVLLLFVPLLKQDLIGSEFIRKNRVFLIGAISFFLINHIHFLRYPVIYIGAFGRWINIGVFVTMGLITLYTIMILSLFTLYMKKNDIANEDQDTSMVEKSLD
ncbi:MAG: hypothetical protein EU529_00505 [Promethearchaeota archaeon]|nr:MAG: hypothetical protein EU529_00505 [Candidatus Lokiarchaeota archaeon]